MILPAQRTVHRLTGVYHADGNLVGEIRYVVGSLLGRTHCALCDITHGHLGEKRSWRGCRTQVPVPFDMVHLDERTPALVAITGAATPAVVAHTDDGLVTLLGPEQLDACAGQPEALLTALGEAMDGRGLTFADQPGP